MKLPYPTFLDQTPIHIDITQGLTEDGELFVVKQFDGKCTFSEKSKTVYDKDGKTLRLSAKVNIGCDIAPDVKVIEGIVTINTVKYNIFSANRMRNPDGSIHHTELELI